ncbi:hypothetical protein Glove_130g188 [Diversispora epigaea]|uniref:Uncharacterized protein n=1 Tax=Diversispora epigaea TaxID=1348612 RepID=A0A397J0L7_9GLOM|nr:hypothetical protein Glove_130g188 [Diversispora epigaea]
MLFKGVPRELEKENTELSQELSTNLLEVIAQYSIIDEGSSFTSSSEDKESLRMKYSRSCCPYYCHVLKIIIGKNYEKNNNVIDNFLNNNKFDKGRGEERLSIEDRIQYDVIIR